MRPRTIAAWCILASVLAYNAFVARWKSDGWGYALSAAALVLIIGMEAGDTFGLGGRAEHFAGLDDITSAFKSLSTVQTTIQDTITSALDEFAATMQPKADVDDKKANASDKNTNGGNDNDKDDDPDNVTMTKDRYKNDPGVLKKAALRRLWQRKKTTEADVDDEKYKKMTSEYAMLHYLMCSLQSVDHATYAKIFKVVLGRDPPPPQPPPGAAAAPSSS